MLPITTYIDALGCENQKSPRLRDLHLESPHSIICAANRAIFPLVGRGKRWWLTVATSGSFPLSEEQIRLRCRITEQTDNPFIRAEYISTALVVFDSLGHHHTVGALLQEAHTPLFEFVRQNCSTKRRSHLRAAIESLAKGAQGVPNHGSLNHTRVCFTESGELRLADYPIVGPEEKCDRFVMGRAALLLHIGGCDINSFKALIEELNISTQEYNRRLRCILSAAEHHGSTRLAALCSALLNEASAETITTAIRELSLEKFQPLELLHPLLTSRSDNGILVKEHPVLPKEEVIKIDFALTDRVEMASDNIVRYKRGDLWGYAHTDGEAIIIDRQVVAAYDFEEGRAVIRTPRGYGLVDTSGELVMNDVWEQLAWYGDENICVGGDELGRWHIYDRMGRQLSTTVCDWMGDAREGFVVARRGGRFGYFATDGGRHTDFIYDEAYSFVDGRALVKQAGRYFHIDTSFHRIVE